MNKYISLVVILFIIYISYEYCSDTIIEGASGGDYDPDKEDAAYDKPKVCSEPPDTSDSINNLTSKIKAPCAFKEQICSKLMTNTGDAWNSFYTDYSTRSETAVDTKGWIMKKNCESCIRGSNNMGTTLNVMSNVSNKLDGTTYQSKFALDYCDALAADCESPLLYANNRQNWEQYDCNGVDAGSSVYSKTNQLVCVLLKSSILQFILSFMGGITCTLKIKAKELETSLKQIPDKMLCSICGFGIPCPKNC
jgi:hypothetical protein